MNSNDNHLDDDMLANQFADGELSEQQQVDFLARCDTEPALWRSLALCFVEHQTWDSAFKSDSAAATADERGGAATAVAKPAAAQTSKRRFDSLLWTTSLALVLALGVLIGRHLVRESGNGLALTHEGPSPGSFTATPKGDEGDEMISLSLNLADGQPQNVRIPVVQAGNNNLLATPNVFRQDVLDHIRRAGYGIDQYRELLSVQLPDGRSVVVPVDNLRVRELSQRDFQ